jgi:hypothetical protein
MGSGVIVVKRLGTTDMEHICPRTETAPRKTPRATLSQFTVFLKSFKAKFALQLIKLLNTVIKETKHFRLQQSPPVYEVDVNKTTERKRKY